VVAADVEFVVAETPNVAAERVAALLAEAARAGSSIALAGGSSPRQAYTLAAGVEPDWSQTEIWLTDERIVPLDDPLSNARLVREALLSGLTGAPAFHTVGTDRSAVEAATTYDAELRAGSPLDVALLGIGPDGHTASLFPNAPALEERVLLATAAAPGLEPWVERVTMTIPALASAAHVVFLAVGTEKADAVHRAFRAPPSRAVPASLVRSTSGRTTVVLDRDAARLL
jgi:6-phosphogluconolactonase